MLKVKIESTRTNYPVFIGYQLLDQANDIFKFYQFQDKILLLTTPKLEKHYRAYLQSCLKPYKGKIYLKTIVGTEKNRNFTTVDEIITFLIAHKFNQKSLIISFGGQALQNIAGFVASTFMTGLAFVPIPTSLPAQLEAVFTTRVSIHHPQRKAALSCEVQPTFAWVDTSFLKSLSIPQITVGVVEALRVAIISEASLFDFIEENIREIYRLDPKSIIAMVHKVCTIKAGFLSKNRTDTHLLKHLNFGKIIGNVLICHRTKWGLGYLEAFFLGPFIEAILSYRLGHLDKREYDRIEALMLKLGVKISIAKIDFEHLNELVRQSANQPDQFAFPKRIGEGLLVNRKIN